MLHAEPNRIIFFDIEAAYDTTWRFGIIRKLFKYSVRGPLGIFLSNFLSERFLPGPSWEPTLEQVSAGGRCATG